MTNSYTTQIDISQHTEQPYIAHNLMADFKIEDVWRLPIILTADQPIGLVRDALFGGMSHIEQKGVAGFLFKLRYLIGRIFGWDAEPQIKEALPAGSLRERYATTHGLTADPLLESSEGAFMPVFITENESLDELENAAVHAALHLGRVPLDEGRFVAQMTIYVKPKGLLGRIYMAAIKPFRHWIVYPAMLRLVEQRWGSVERVEADAK